MKDPLTPISDILRMARRCDLRREHIPMEYVPGLPLLAVRNGELCLIVPYLRYRTTGKVDETLVFPVRYTAVWTVPEGILVEFRDLRYDPAFSKVDFGKACGKFRHEAVRDLDSAAYSALRGRAVADLDRLALSLLGKEEWSGADEARLRQTLSRLLEPSLRGMYHRIDPDFCNKYYSDNGAD